ncbi:MAG: ATP-binding protein [Pseudohongiellaceae bacterium]
MSAHQSRYSLRVRMLVVLGAVLLLFLGFTGIALDRAYRNSVEGGAAERLQIQVYLLLAALEQEAGEFFVIEDIQEPRYAAINSGLYGFVYDAALTEMWRSDSALALSLSQGEQSSRIPEVGEAIFDTVIDSNGERLFRFSYGILWEGIETPFSVSVAELAAPYFSEIRDFRRSLGRWLGGAAALLLILLLVLLRWGLRPLARLSLELRNIERGISQRLTGDYPDELWAVTENLNRLIDSERRQRERYKTTLADLAHSLKTPLSVASGAVDTLSSSSLSAPNLEEGNAQLLVIKQALERMDQIVAYQLQRAVSTQNHATLALRVNVATAVSELLAVLEKVYAGRRFIVESQCDEDLQFRGDERDLLEVLGNTLDNAFKYGAARIRLIAKQGDDGALEFFIEDDGPGIPLEQREFVLQRGARADTLAQGQGIGLAVVSDIMASYQGSVSIEISDLGGAKFVLTFPQPETEPTRK